MMNDSFTGGGSKVKFELTDFYVNLNLHQFLCMLQQALAYTQFSVCMRFRIHSIHGCAAYILNLVRQRIPLPWTKNIDAIFSHCSATAIKKKNNKKKFNLTSVPASEVVIGDVADKF
jgi:hypothetical protein